MKSRLLIRATQGLLYALALFVLAALIMMFASREVYEVFATYYGEGGSVAKCYAFLTVAGVLALYILTELILVMRTVTDDPFTERNARSFLRMGVAAEVAGALFVFKCFTLFSPMTAVCAVVMVLSGLFALVLSGVFARAVEYKRENDLTI